MDAVLTIVTIVAILSGIGAVLILTDRHGSRPRWLAVGAVLVALEDLLLTNVYGLGPRLIGGDWNWQGKFLALASMMAIAAHPAFGWGRVGLTLRQRPGALRACLPVVAVYIGFFVALALAVPNEPNTAEELAFQLTLPGLEEELFYRGVLLLALNEAFRGRVSFLGIEWGWGAVLSSLIFGLAHALSFDDGSIALDPLVLALTAIPSLIAVWLRERSGSLVLPILAHNAGNSISLLL